MKKKGVFCLVFSLVFLVTFTFASLDAYAKSSGGGNVHTHLAAFQNYGKISKYVYKATRISIRGAFKMGDAHY